MRRSRNRASHFAPCKTGSPGFFAMATMAFRSCTNTHPRPLHSTMARPSLRVLAKSTNDTRARSSLASPKSRISRDRAAAVFEKRDDDCDGPDDDQQHRPQEIEVQPSL